MSAQRLVSKSKQSELSVRMTLTIGSLIGGGWTFMDAWSSFSSFNSESDLVLGTFTKIRDAQEGSSQCAIIHLHT